MIYRIVTYSKATERMSGNLPIPWSHVAKIRKMAGVTPLDDGLGEYTLNDEQVRQIAGILGFRPEPERFYYCLEPFDQPDAQRSQPGDRPARVNAANDNGLRQETSLPVPDQLPA